MNKKLPLIGIILLLVMALFVGATLDFSDPSTISGNPGELIFGSFTLETDIDITNIEFNDLSVTNMGDVIEVTTNTIPTLSAGEIRTIDFEVDIPAFQDEGTYNGVINVKYNDSVTIIEEFYNFTIEVNEVTSMTLDSTIGDLRLKQEEIGTIDVTITNNGNDDLTNVILSYDQEDFEDEGNNELILAFNNNDFSLNAGASQIVTISATPDEDQYLGDISGEILITSTEEASASYTLTVETYTDLLDIDIDTPSSIDDLSPGEGFDFDVNIDDLDYDMEDITIKVWIIDIDDGDNLDSESDTFDLDRGDDKDINFKFDIPYNVDEDQFDIKVRVQGEEKDDSSNDFEFILIYENEVEVVKDQDEEVAFDNVHFSTSSTAFECGAIFTVYTDVINTGDDDLDDMYIKLEIEELGLEYTSNLFDLDENDYDKREESIDFLVTLPNGLTEDSYTMKFYAYNEDDDLFEVKYQSIDVISCSIDNGDDEGTYEPIGDDGVIYLPTGFVISDLISGENVKIVFWVLADLLLLAAIIWFIVWISRRKTVKQRKR
jgi:uncharacterized membrane protein